MTTNRLGRIVARVLAAALITAGAGAVIVVALYLLLAGAVAYNRDPSHLAQSDNAKLAYPGATLQSQAKYRYPVNGRYSDAPSVATTWATGASSAAVVAYYERQWGAPQSLDRELRSADWCQGPGYVALGWGWNNGWAHEVQQQTDQAYLVVPGTANPYPNNPAAHPPLPSCDSVLPASFSGVAPGTYVVAVVQTF